MAREHPVRLVVSEEGLGRSRLTTFFRLLLALPHLVWLGLWGVAVVVVAPIQWVVTLVRGRPSGRLHAFLGRYVRYWTHVYAYLLLAANPFPGFVGGPYVVDLELPEPGPQRRLVTGFRLALALPALILTGVLVGLGGGGGVGSAEGDGGDAAFLAAAGGVAITVAFLAWFAILARGRIPRGFRDFLAYALRYAAQTWAYVLLVTDRYPDADTGEPRLAGALSAKPVRLVVRDEGRRSRLTVFFRLPLAFPHFAWLVLWGIAALLAAVANWLAVLVRGRSPGPLHRFLAAYLRYRTHVFAFIFLVANPFPGFTGAGGYPVDLEVDAPERQRRLVTAFRLLLVVGLFGWFASLSLGRMPQGLRNAGAYVLRYSAQTYAYAESVLTDEYPFSGPLPAAEEPRPSGEEPPPAPGEWPPDEAGPGLEPARAPG